MTVGWIEDHVRDGKVVDGEAGKMEVQTNGDAQMNGAVKSKGESRLNGELLTNGVH